MATKSKATTQIKFEVGQLVEFNNRFGQVSRIAKNGSVYVIVLGETSVADQTREELRVKKADLQLVNAVLECAGDAVSVVEGQGIEQSEAFADAAQEIVAEVQDPQAPALPDAPAEPVQPTLILESTKPAAAVALADATYALRELTFSGTRHSILTAFIDMALNKGIAGYHQQVASNIKNLMAAAFDPVHDAIGYARINTWTMAALELLVKHKDRVAKMLNQPIEAAPIKIDRVTKLGLWLDKNMHREGTTINDLTAAYDSCYMYDAIGKKLKACAFVVVEVAQAMDSDKVEVKVPKDAMGYYTKHLTAQSAISARRQHGDRVRRKSPDWHIYCGIVPIYKTGAPIKEAVEEMLADVISSRK